MLALEIKGKSALIVGAGISGFAAAEVMKGLGAARVVLSDAKAEKDIKEDLSPLRELGIELAFGPQGEELLSGMDYLLLSPAVPERIPLVRAARSRGIRVTTEVELAYELARSPIFAITGTNGKTTTVTLLGLLLAAHFGEGKTGVGGNIGIPLSKEVLRVGEGGAIAAEISSYQMEATAHFTPRVACVLNVTPDHVVRHGSLEVYQAMKEKMFASQAPDDFVVLNCDDEKTRGMAARAKSRVLFFSRKKELEEGAYLRSSRLVISFEGKTHELCTIEELGIKGAHNVENALAASLVAFLAGVSAEEMRPVLMSFTGVEHRIEPVRVLDGASYYNDSKATNTDSAVKALETFPKDIILIAGGRDKMTDLADFMKLARERCSHLVLIGEAAERFHAAALAAGFGEGELFMEGFSMEAAVKRAQALAREGSVVLLSPACASFDMYGSFEERGRDFKRIVNDLKGQG